jgi:pyruvate-ferredoxin/flavodoxin oxidoreductase
MTYGNIYVAQIAMGANDSQSVKAFQEAESYDGPSLVIAYSHCISHGLEGDVTMASARDEQQAAVDCGHWMLYRFDPRRAEQGENPLQLDSKEPKASYADYAKMQARFNSLKKTNPEAAQELIRLGEGDCRRRWSLYNQLAQLPGGACATQLEEAGAQA